VAQTSGLRTAVEIQHHNKSGIDEATQTDPDPEESVKSADAVFHESLETARQCFIRAAIATGLSNSTAKEFADETIATATKAIYVHKARSSWIKGNTLHFAVSSMPRRIKMLTNLAEVGQNPSGKLQVLHHADWVEENGLPVCETHAKSLRDLIQMEVLFGVYGREISSVPNHNFPSEWYFAELVLIGRRGLCNLFPVQHKQSTKPNREPAPIFAGVCDQKFYDFYASKRCTLVSGMISVSNVDAHNAAHFVMDSLRPGQSTMISRPDSMSTKNVVEGIIGLRNGTIWSAHHINQNWGDNCVANLMHADRVIQALARDWKPPTRSQNFWWEEKKSLLSGDHPMSSNPIYCAIIHDQAEVQAGPIEVLYQVISDRTLEETLKEIGFDGYSLDMFLLERINTGIQW
jgi:hypothetical protein